MMTMRVAMAVVLAVVTVALACAPGVRAQGSRKDDVVFNAQGRPMAGATVRVCTVGATGQPCTPLALIYSDEGLTQALANPIAADGMGNYTFYAAPGRYEIEISGPQIITKQMPNVILPNDPSTPTFTTVSTTSGITAFTLTLSGNLTVSGAAAVGTLTVGGASVPTVAQDLTWTNNQRFKGPDPWADITAFGARAAVSNYNDGATTVTCTNGSANVTLGSASFFVNGDGVTLQGCGATNTMTTPTAPTVVPVFASGGTGTHLTVNSSTGASTYLYKVVGRDKYGALTLPSSATTITTGLASLGLQTAAIASVSRSNDTVTVTTSTSLSLIAGQMVDMTLVPGNTFNGWFRICSITSGTVFTLCATPTDTRNQTSNLADQTSAGSGGTLAYYSGNSVRWTFQSGVWEYYTCASRPADSGAYHVIGVSKPNDPTSGFQDNQYEDWGATYQGNQTFPYYVTDSICTAASATNDPLTTTIVSGAGTTSLALATTALNNNVAGNQILLDAAPAITAAATASVNGVGNIYIPPAADSAHGFPINSFLSLTNQGLSVRQAGRLLLGETLEINGAMNWDGSWASLGAPQFSTNSGAAIYDSVASPGIHLRGGDNVLRWLNVDSYTNGTTLIVEDSGQTLFEHVNLLTGGVASTDYLGMAMVYRDTSGTIADHSMSWGDILGGPSIGNDLSWTPLVWMAAGQNGSGGWQNSFYDVQLHYMNFSRRGIEIDGGGNAATLGMDWVYRQGGYTPMVTITNAGNNTFYKFFHVYQDTENEPLVANLCCVAGNSFQGTFDFDLVTGGAQTPLISGNRPVSLRLKGWVVNGGDAYGTTLGPNRSVSEDKELTYTVTYPFETSGLYTYNAEPMRKLYEPEAVVGGYSHYWVLPPPTSITATAASGGSVPAGTYVYSVSATGIDGGETIAQPAPSSTVTTSSGTQTVNVGWTPTVGAASYNVYRCNTSNTCTIGGVIGGTVFGVGFWYRVASHVTGTTYADTAASSPTNSMPAFSGTGVSGINDQYVWGKTFACPETSAPAGVAGFDFLYCDATAHRWKKIENNGAAQTVGSADSAACAYQGPATAVTGTGAAATYYTCTLPAGVMGAGQGIIITVVAKHTTGTAAVNYTLSFGGTSTTAVAPAGAANQLERTTYLIMNNAGSTSAQTINTLGQDSNAGSNSIKLDTSAVSTASAVTINLQFNVAATDAITPEMFLVELKQ
jgi:hypothetical protein